MHKAVFFDRDGVINRAVVKNGKPYPPRVQAEFVWMDGVHETLSALRDRGYLLFVFTNQPDVARGTLDRSVVEGFHERLLRELPIRRIYACFHDDADGCSCRKPKPGMLYQGRDDYGIDLAASWVVGDRWKDIEAGKAAGCRTAYLNDGYDERPASGYDRLIGRLDELLTFIT